MTFAAKQRRTLRHTIAPILVEYLNTRTSMRRYSRPSQIRAGARLLARQMVARHLRYARLQAA